MSETEKILDRSISVSLEDLVKTLFAPLVFLASYALLFDYIQSTEQLVNEPVDTTSVKDVQKKALYMSLIPGLIAAFAIINTTGMFILILLVILKFFYVNS